ncbi:MAG: hypothetical protein ABIV43_03820 [Candidatus Saccharimonadales bacterium]
MTLPIIARSIANHEPIYWVFSAQMNLFPEGIIYAFAASVTTSVRATLVFNAVLNIVLFYGLLRLLLRMATSQSVERQRLLAVGGALALVGFSLLESYNPNQAMATYSLFSTYYFGLLVSGMSVLCLMLWQYKCHQSCRARSTLLVSMSIVVVTALTVSSNPLYVPQFAAPIVLAIIVMFVLKLFDRVTSIWMVCTQALGILIGLGLHQILSSFLGQTLGSHSSGFAGATHPVDALFYALGAIAPPNPQQGTVLRIVLSVLIYFSCLLYVLFRLNSRLKSDTGRYNPSSYLVLIFVAIEPIVLILLTAAIGGAQNRYLSMPIFISIIGMVIILGEITTVKLWRAVCRLVTLVVVCVILAGVISLPRISPLLSTDYPDGECLAAALDYRPANGISGYWTARALDIYGQQNIRVLQTSGYSPFAWLNNLATYQNKTYSFVVIPRDVMMPMSASLDQFRDLGQPSKFSRCPTVDVYQYMPGTVGYSRLNYCLQQALSEELVARKQGTIASLSRSAFIGETAQCR